MDIHDIIKASGYTKEQISARYGIPRRTIDAWASGSRRPAPYVLVMLSDILTLERMVQDHGKEAEGLEE